VKSLFTVMFLFTSKVIKYTIILSLILAGGFLFCQGIDMAAVNAEENFQWGVRAFHNGYYNQAIFYFEKALSFKPNNVTERIWLGRTLYKSGFEDAALNEWNNVLGQGKGTALLENIIQVISIRRGLLTQIVPEDELVTSTIIDATKNGYHPFRRPTSVRPRKDGTFFIVAFGTNEIIHIDANGTVIDVLRGGIEGFDHPFDVLETDDGFLFVSEYEGARIAKCTLEGDKIKIIGKKGIKEGELLAPQFLAMDSKGYIYTTDYGNKRVTKYDQDGNYILTIGTNKETGAVLGGPTGIATIDGSVYIADNIKKKIFVFDESGNSLTSYGQGFLKGPEGIFFLDGNTLLVADTSTFAEETRIVKLDIKNERWTIHSDIGNQSERLLHIAADPNADFFVVDYNLNKIFTLTPMSVLSQGLFVQIERVEAHNFPDIMLDVAVQDREGNPVVGLKKENFVITESYKPVAREKVLLYQPVQEAPLLDIVILVEKSEKIGVYKKELVAAANSICDLAGNNRAITVVAAGENGVLEAGRDASQLNKIDSITTGSFSQKWRFDSGLRMAATRLLSARSKRAIIFLTEGSPGDQPFTDYTLLELLHYMRNNYIGFYVLNVGTTHRLHDDIAFLCEETDGKAYSYYEPDGIRQCIDHIKNRKDPRYVLKYQSQSDTRFGRRFIGVEVEVVLRKRNGRDENGYYGPIQF
jgi:hypothetical protein